MLTVQRKALVRQLGISGLACLREIFAAPETRHARASRSGKVDVAR
jgi:hypothetical protein